MKKIAYLLILTALLIPGTQLCAQASLISDRSYRSEQNREYKQAVKDIKNVIQYT